MDTTIKTFMAVYSPEFGEKRTKALNVLKEELRANGFKVCGMGASIMLSQLNDIGLSDDAYHFFSAVAAELPYSPAEALED